MLIFGASRRLAFSAYSDLEGGEVARKSDDWAADANRASYTLQSRVGSRNVSRPSFSRIFATVQAALGILEVFGLTPAMIALDTMEKAAEVRLFQWELNDWSGVVLKMTGDVSALRSAIDAGHAVSEQLQARPTSTIINRPDDRAMAALKSPLETSAVLQQGTVKNPNYEIVGGKSEVTVADQSSQALGFIETQGFVAVFEAIDSACKAANVEVIGKEKLGGGYITVVIRGDVAAVKAAIDAGTARAATLGKVIAGHVIARPSAGVMSLLPKS